MDCSGDACEWVDTGVSIVIHTYELTEAGTDIPGWESKFSYDSDVHGYFEGALHLKVGTERVSP